MTQIETTYLHVLQLSFSVETETQEASASMDTPQAKNDDKPQKTPGTKV